MSRQDQFSNHLAGCAANGVHGKRLTYESPASERTRADVADMLTPPRLSPTAEDVHAEVVGTMNKVPDQIKHSNSNEVNTVICRKSIHTIALLLCGLAVALAAAAPAGAMPPIPGGREHLCRQN